MDGDLARSHALQLNGGGEPDRATTDHANIALAGAQRQLRGQCARAPGKRPPASAMAIVMDDCLLTDALEFESRSGRAEGARAYRDAGDAIHRQPQWLQRREGRRA